MVSAVVVAGGVGKRMSIPLPKQFLEIRGKPLIFYSLRAFQLSEATQEICLVLPAGMVDKEKHLKKVLSHLDVYQPLKLKYITEGGPSRQQSVLKGLRALEAKPDYVAIHDASRPLVSTALIDRVIKAAKQYGAAAPVISVRDTIKRTSQGKITATVGKEDLVMVQTPQVFSYDLILEAHLLALKKGIENAFDDTYLLELLGKDVFTVEGENSNIKLTYPSDIPMLEALLSKVCYE